jgi:hypothetical protein
MVKKPVQHELMEHGAGGLESVRTRAAVWSILANDKADGGPGRTNPKAYR